MGRGTSGKIAVVTGAAQGLGQAFAVMLAGTGARVIAVDQRPSDETVTLIHANGGNAESAACDLADSAAIAAWAAKIGACDILVNNAGVFPNQSFEVICDADWRRVMAINLDAPFYLARAFAPAMKAKGWGRIVNISSATVGTAGPGSAHYITSKMGVIGLTRALATELGGFGVTVNAIAPGLVKTPGTTDRFARDAEGMAQQTDVFAKFAARQAIKISMTPHDIVGALSFLVSDDAAFMTGQTLYVDGGTVRV